ncbi:PTS sugar transporter subunit IIA [Listeria welshimeri]|nr:PTS sugar transporter subunit IIA [Listeria welshimeri]
MENNMSNIIVMTHGEFAEGIVKSAEMIIGEQKNLKFVTFHPEMCLDSLVLEFKTKIKEFNNDYPCLIFVDLFGGSPSNAVAILLAENYDIQAIAGVNLPMLLEVLGGRTIFPIDTLVKQAEVAGMEGVVNIVKRFLED